MIATINKQPQHTLEISAYKLASSIVLALQECKPELRDVAIELLEQLRGDLDPEAAQATTHLISDILFPTTDPTGSIGLDLLDAEAISPNTDPSIRQLVKRMDQQEATFSERLRNFLELRGMTQLELAEKIGVGQPAVSMILNRTCRPQRKTIEKIAEALGVSPSELWSEGTS